MESDSRGSRPIHRRAFLKYLILGGAAALVGLAVEGNNLHWSLFPNTPHTYPKTGYTIQQVNGQVQAIPAPGSSSPVLTSTDAAIVIAEACVPNSQVFIKAGTYTIGSGLNIQNRNNVELYGESGTVLKLADGTNSNVLQFSSGDGIYIHDLEIDGNRFSQAGGAGGGTVDQGDNLAGFAFYYCTNSTIQNCHVHDSRCFGIVSLAGSNIKILNNLVENCDANGMNLGGNDGGGSGLLCSGNTVDGASDVGIASWNGQNLTVTNNTIRNITMTRSPFGWQSREFLSNEHSASSSPANNTFQNNTCDNCTGPAIYMSGGTNVLFNGNHFTNCREAFILDTSPASVTLTNNTFDRIGQVSGGAGGAAVDVSAGSAHSITGNSFTNVGAYLTESNVIELTGGAGTFSNNTVSTSNGKYKAISAGSGWTVSNNTIIP